MKHIKPKKSLGQNFLIDKNIAINTVDTLEINENDIVLEIGPGEGALTELILQKAKKVYCVELDYRAIEILQKKFAHFIPNKVEIIYSDILKFNIKEFYEKNNFDQKLKVLGNIPYYISSEIFFLLFNNANYVSNAVLTIQKEVAQRLAAKYKTKAYGILTVARELVSDAKLEFDVPPTCFYPAPNVMSAVIKIDFYKDQKDFSEYKALMDFVKAAFNQRRKVLKNSLTSYLKSRNIYDEALMIEDFNFYLKKRAEELLLSDFIKMYNIILELQKK